MPDCKFCRTHFEDWKGLALHIQSSKTGHYFGKKWAAHFLMIGGLSPEKQRDRPRRRAPEPSEHTELWAENQLKATRQMSGENAYEATVCPLCGKPSRQLLPVEYAADPWPWRVRGVLMVMCDRCRGIKR
jgi:hypothetical protein